MDIVQYNKNIVEKQKKSNEDVGLVSIITPSYNCACYIGETIKSILSQTYKNWELLLVDDCSTDTTDAVVASFGDPRIRYFKNEKRSGAAVSRNRALREAKGRWIAFIDSDDLWMPTKLEQQIRFMVENGYGVSCTDYIEINKYSRELGIYITAPKHISKWTMYAYCWLGCLTVMYDVQKIGLIQVVDLKKNNDYAMWLQVCRKENCHLLKEPLAKYRRREQSISNHSYISLIKWHYRLFRHAENMNSLSAGFMTGINMVFGMMKKMLYMKRYHVD